MIYLYCNKDNVFYKLYTLRFLPKNTSRHLVYTKQKCLNRIKKASGVPLLHKWGSVPFITDCRGVVTVFPNQQHLVIYIYNVYYTSLPIRYKNITLSLLLKCIGKKKARFNKKKKINYLHSRKCFFISLLFRNFKKKKR